MEVSLVNHSKISFPRKLVRTVLFDLCNEKKLRKALDRAELTVVFLDPLPAKKLNRLFRGRKYATDILSFASGTPENSGELVLCPQVLKLQAKEHQHSFKAELTYMLIHGVLHLLGYDHEGRGRLAEEKARRMYALQDQIFDRLRKKYDF